MFVETLDESYVNQEVEDKYRIWKKHTPYFYDCVITKLLEWPSLTVQWLPSKDMYPRIFLGSLLTHLAR